MDTTQTCHRGVLKSAAAMPRLTRYVGASRGLLWRLLPRTAGSAFWRGSILSLFVGLTMATILPATLGLCTAFGGRLHDGYWDLATNLIRGHGFVFQPGGPPVLHRPPLTPVIFSPLTLLPTTMQRPSLVALQSIVVGAACFLLFDLTSRLRGAATASVAVGLLLFYPWMLLQVKHPMNALLQMLCVLLVVYVLARELIEGMQSQSPERGASWHVRAALLGLACAATVLTHGTMMLSVLLLLVATIGLGIWHRRRRLVLVPLVAGCIAVLAVAPWTYRNWNVSGRFIPVVSNAGLAYFWGYAHWTIAGDVHEEMAEAFRLAGIDASPPEVTHFWGTKDPALGALFDRRMIAHAVNEPLALVQKARLNGLAHYFPVVHDWLLSDVRENEKWVYAAERIVQSLWHLVLWCLAIGGLCRSWRDRGTRSLSLLLGIIAVLVFPYLPFLGDVVHCQYALVTIPLLMILAATALVSSAPNPANRPPSADPEAACTGSGTIAELVPISS